ncbi:hypothetical protein IMSAGC013_01918 [Lachnospiraceae bacterium]|nr:hypothetical protein IMSAGC013_01918 [Lachnospiraceae bacterium]
MRNFLIGAAIVAVTMMILMAVSIFCNVEGIYLESTAIGVVLGIGAMMVYQKLTKGKTRETGK